MAKPKTMRLLVKIDRIAAWVLLFSFLLFYFTGYGMLKYLMDGELAKYIHDRLLPVPILVAFAYHSTFAVHLSLKRWKMWHKRTLYWLLAVSVVIVTGFTLIHYGVIKGTPPVQTMELD